MAEVLKKGPKVTEYYRDEDQFAPGNACCPGCVMELNLRLVSKIMGRETVLLGTPGCSAPTIHGQNDQAWHKHSYYANVMTGVASSASGLARYYRKAGKNVTLVCHTGDGCAQDIGFQTLSGAAERNENVIYICYDNEGYMNTGVQRSSATPFGASTSTTPAGSESIGKPTHKKNMPLIMSMHDIPYVATATMSHLEDYAKKLTRAREKVKEGFVYLHVFCPCAEGWKVPSDGSISVCRAAVQTNYFPLWESEWGKYQITQPVRKQKPIFELLKLIGKFKHLKDEDIQILQKEVDKRFSVLKALGDIGTVE
jgi:pyruvate/2-oxoacid:ferredoxin oxidoreductase beta subunit